MSLFVKKPLDSLLNEAKDSSGHSLKKTLGAWSLIALGIGAIIGAGAAILFAPSSGRETRRRLGDEASKLGTAALDAVREQKDEALRNLSHVANGAVGSSARS